MGELVLNLGEEKKLKKLDEHENYVTLVKSIKALDLEIKEKETQAEHAEVAENEESAADKG